MVKRRFIPFLFFLFFLFVSLYPKTDLSDQIKDVEFFIKNQMEVEKIPGIALGIMKGEFIWAKGFGFSDLENKIPMKENSSFRLASVTKTMTATAILQLAEKGKINLDDEVQKYVPYFPRKNYPVIIRYLLGHLGGIPITNPMMSSISKFQRTQGRQLKSLPIMILLQSQGQFITTQVMDTISLAQL